MHTGPVTGGEAWFPWGFSITFHEPFCTTPPCHRIKEKFILAVQDTQLPKHDLMLLQH